MGKSLEKHSCMSSSFPIVMLNGTSFFRQCNYQCTKENWVRDGDTSQCTSNPVSTKLNLAPLIIRTITFYFVTGSKICRSLLSSFTLRKVSCEEVYFSLICHFILVKKWIVFFIKLVSSLAGLWCSLFCRYSNGTNLRTDGVIAWKFVHHRLIPLCWGWIFDFIVRVHVKYSCPSHVLHACSVLSVHLQCWVCMCSVHVQC